MTPSRPTLLPDTRLQSAETGREASLGAATHNARERKSSSTARVVWVLAGWISCGLLLPNCGTDAVGTEACREIEEARCEAASACGVIEDVDDCRLYYRDHCLHGVATKEAPRSVEIRQCVAALQDVRQCARRKGKNATPAECSAVSLSASTRRVCDASEQPERLEQCAFLDPESEFEPPEAPDAGNRPAEAGTEMPQNQTDAGGR